VTTAPTRRPRLGVPDRLAGSRRLQLAVIGVPVMAWILWWLGGSYFTLLIQSFWKTDGFSVKPVWNLDSYIKIFTQDYFLKTLGKSFLIAGITVVLATMLAFPVAYFITFKMTKRRSFGYVMVIVPLWVSYLVRAYAWKVILGEQGFLNTALMNLGVIHQPLTFLLYSPFAVILTLTHIYTPFMILTIYAVLEHIPPSYIEASRDLGAGGFRTFLRVTLPLAMPGIVAGGLFSFGLAAGDFVAPLLVGGPDAVMISNIIASQFGAANNWPLGAALAGVMLAAMVVVIRLASWVEARSLT
jgi:spermidine/putrescine transport system permease protein